MTERTEERRETLRKGNIYFYFTVASTARPEGRDGKRNSEGTKETGKRGNAVCRGNAVTERNAVTEQRDKGKRKNNSNKIFPQ